MLDGPDTRSTLPRITPMKVRLKLTAALLAATLSGASMASPLIIEEQGSFAAGGKVVTSPGT